MTYQKEEEKNMQVWTGSLYGWYGQTRLSVSSTALFFFSSSERIVEIY